MSALDDLIAQQKSFDAPNTSMGSAADYYNGPTTPLAPTPAPSSGTPPPAPFVPSPNVQTPVQAANGYIPPPNPSPTAAGGKGPSQAALPVPVTDSSKATPIDLQSALASKGAAKGPSGGQQSMQLPSQTTFAPATAAPMDFHTQLQNFINSGLLAGSQRLNG
jgi:hypothetical protein